MTGDFIRKQKGILDSKQDGDSVLVTVGSGKYTFNYAMN